MRVTITTRSGFTCTGVVTKYVPGVYTVVVTDKGKTYQVPEFRIATIVEER